ncbi:MAG: GC-type dockerin domain-anchored protein [Planctomycetota bacterium]
MHRTLTTLAALAAGPALAQPFEITRSTIDNGGGTLSSANYTLSGTIAQPDASEALAGSSYTLRGGFWTTDAASPRLCADQNGDGLVSPADFNAWVLNFNTQSLVADTNQDGLVNPGDFNAWILAFNQGANGPLCNP